MESVTTAVVQSRVTAFLMSQQAQKGTLSALAVLSVMHFYHQRSRLRNVTTVVALQRAMESRQKRLQNQTTLSLQPMALLNPSKLVGVVNVNSLFKPQMGSRLSAIIAGVLAMLTVRRSEGEKIGANKGKIWLYIK